MGQVRGPAVTANQSSNGVQVRVSLTSNRCSRSPLYMIIARLQKLISWDVFTGYAPSYLSEFILYLSQQ